MILNHGIHLGLLHEHPPRRTWARKIPRGLRDYTLRVRERVAADQPYGIGLRLSEQAARELNVPAQLSEFKRWLDAHDCYVFTINAFPYGAFHGQPVKESVPSRLDDQGAARLHQPRLRHPLRTAAARHEWQREHAARLAQDLRHRFRRTGGDLRESQIMPRAHRTRRRAHRS